MAKRLPKQEVVPKELDDSDILTWVRKSNYKKYITINQHTILVSKCNSVRYREKWEALRKLNTIN